MFYIFCWKILCKFAKYVGFRKKSETLSGKIRKMKNSLKNNSKGLRFAQFLPEKVFQRTKKNVQSKFSAGKME